MKELSELKETYKKQCEIFVEEVKKLDKIIIEHNERLTQYCQEIEKTTIEHKGVLDLHTSQVKELYARMELVENNVIELQKDTKKLQLEKTDLKIFMKAKKMLECYDLENEIKIYKAVNHCVTLDNYLEKYLPIRTQALINETLRSVLSGKERRRLELYDNEKNSILYQYLLVDDGRGNVSEIMRELHERASIEIEEEDRRKKHRMAITEASMSKEEVPNGQPS